MACSRGRVHGRPDRERPGHPGALSRGRLHPHAAAQSAQPVLHVDEPRAEAAPVSIESLAVIDDVEGQGRTFFPYPQLQRGLVPGMLACVLDGLQAAEVDRRFDLRRVPANRAGLHRDRQRGPAGRRGQGRHQPLVGEQRRVDAVRQAPQFIRRLPDIGAEFREEVPRLACVAFGESGGQAQLDGQGSEPLLGAVMKVTLDPAPLGVGRGHDPGPCSRRKPGGGFPTWSAARA